MKFPPYTLISQLNSKKGTPPLYRRTPKERFDCFWAVRHGLRVLQALSAMTQSQTYQCGHVQGSSLNSFHSVSEFKQTNKQTLAHVGLHTILPYPDTSAAHSG